MQRGLREHAVRETALGVIKTGPFSHRQQRVEVGLDQGWVEPPSGEGGLEGFKETSFVTKAPTGAGKIAVARAVIRIQGKRPGIGSLGLLETPEIAQHIAQVVGEGKVLQARPFQGS